MTAFACSVASELIDVVFDPDSFESWDEPIDTSGHSPAYRQELDAASELSGHDESVRTGLARLAGRPMGVIVSEFRFLGGSIGLASAERIVSTVRRATAEGLPLVASTASGGTRMQEGTPAFVRMAEIAKAIMAHRAMGLPYLVHLRHPTTGGVLASWGSLGHITVAEPGALIAFLGPKVYEVLNGKPFPPSVQRAENLVRHGVVDAVVPTEKLAAALERALCVLRDPAGPGTFGRRQQALRAVSPWDSVLRTRDPSRPGIREILDLGGSATVHLSGTAEGEHDSTVVAALTRLDNHPCVILGQDRSAQTPSTPMGPGALRVARRAMNLAEELRLPFVSFVDTSGAELSAVAEERAMAGEIARCIGTLVSMRVPTVSALIGQGTGGGALALLAAKRVVVAEHSWLSPLAPEGASAIVFGDAAHAAEMAQSQRIGALDLLSGGFAHAIVPELPAAEETAETFSRAVVAEVSAQLRELKAYEGSKKC